MEKEKRIHFIGLDQITLFEFWTNPLMRIKRPNFLHKIIVKYLTNKSRKRHEIFVKKYITLKDYQEEQAQAQAFKDNTKKAIEKIYTKPGE